MDILVAEPVLVNIRQDFLLAFKGKDFYDRLEQAIGINFGCLWAGDGFNEFVNDTSLADILFEQALAVFVFDILILNADRRTEKQNLKNNGKEIVIFDHESAFGFVFDIFPNKEPWILQEHDKEWIQNHLFYQEIKRNYRQFDVKNKIENLVNRFKNLGADFWTKAKDLVPSKWKEGHTQIDKIEQRITLIIQNTDKFTQQITELLQ